jgi:hypothetical protein
LKQLLHVSVQSPSSVSALFELANVMVAKIINYNTLVLLIRWCGHIYYQVLVGVCVCALFGTLFRTVHIHTSTST